MKFLGSYPAAGEHAHQTREHADARWRQADDWINSRSVPHDPLSPIGPIEPAWPGTSGDLDDEALEVGGLGHGEVDRVVARLVQPADDPGLPPGVERGAGDDLLEQLLARPEPEHENVNSSPPGSSSWNAWRFRSL